MTTSADGEVPCFTHEHGCEGSRPGMPRVLDRATLPTSNQEVARSTEPEALRPSVPALTLQHGDEVSSPATADDYDTAGLVPPWEAALLSILRAGGRFNDLLEAGAVLSVPETVVRTRAALQQEGFAAAFRTLSKLRVRVLLLVLMLPGCLFYSTSSRRRTSVLIAPVLCSPVLLWASSYNSADHYIFGGAFAGVVHTLMVASWLREDSSSSCCKDLVETARPKLFLACQKASSAVILNLWLLVVVNSYLKCDVLGISVITISILICGYVGNEFRIYLWSTRHLQRDQLSEASTGEQAFQKVYGVDGVRATHPILCTAILSVGVVTSIYSLGLRLGGQGYVWKSCSTLSPALLLTLHWGLLLFPILWAISIVLSVTDRPESVTPSSFTIVPPFPSSLKTCIGFCCSWFGLACLNLSNMVLSLGFALYYAYTLQRATDWLEVVWVLTAFFGVFLTASTIFGRLLPVSKFFPCDDSFRVTVVLKITLLLIKSEIISESTPQRVLDRSHVSSQTFVEVSYVISLGLAALLTITYEGFVAWRYPHLLYRIRHPKFFIICYVVNFLVSKAMALHILCVVGSFVTTSNYHDIKTAYYPSLCFLVYLNNEISKFIDGSIEFSRLSGYKLTDPNPLLESPLLSKANYSSIISGGRPGLSHCPDGLKSVLAFCALGQMLGLISLAVTQSKDVLGHILGVHEHSIAHDNPFHDRLSVQACFTLTMLSSASACAMCFMGVSQNVFACISSILTLFTFYSLTIRST
eukprot:gene17906-21320_t